MLILISPAKTLDVETAAPVKTATQPALLDDAGVLAEQLKTLSAKKISTLMNISDKLGQLNQQRYADWQTPFTKKTAKQAILTFKGDVYTGLEADTFSDVELKFAQQHLRILSGLYGVLRPLDLMQPYRLEMGTALKNQRGKDLYSFWGDSITEELNKQLKKLRTDAVINLASNEYFRAVNSKQLAAEIISPAFRDLKNGQYKIISFYAKKARGQMAAWIIRNAISRPQDLRKFAVAGYRFSDELSTPATPVFTRDKPQTT